MLSAWWTADGADTRLGPDFSSATVDFNNKNDFWDHVKIEAIGRLYQRPYSLKASRVRENSGYFFLENTANDATTDAGDCYIDTPDYIAERESQARDIAPFGDADGVRGVLPAIIEAGASSKGTIACHITTRPDGEIGDWGPFYLKHYQPWAWYGQGAEIIPSMLMQLGIDQDYIDTASFDDCYESSASNYLNLLVAREFGTPIIETIKEIAASWIDLLYYTMDGKIAIAAPYGTSALTGLEGVIGPIRWRYADEYLCNKMNLSYGQMVRCSDYTHNTPTKWDHATEMNKEVDNDDYNYRAEYDSTMSNVDGDGFNYELSVTASETKYGTRQLGGNVVAEDGPLTVSVARTHRRLQVQSFSRLGVISFLSTYIIMQSDARREATVTQDLRGLDYDVGHIVTLAVGGDSAVDFVCISKSIDYDNLTVTSVLLEE